MPVRLGRVRNFTTTTSSRRDNCCKAVVNADLNPDAVTNLDADTAANTYSDDAITNTYGDTHRLQSG